MLSVWFPTTKSLQRNPLFVSSKILSLIFVYQLKGSATFLVIEIFLFLEQVQNNYQLSKKCQGEVKSG